MSGRFLDIDNILRDEERIPCEFRISSKFLVCADTTGDIVQDDGKGGEYLPEGARIELPLWHGEALNKRNYVDMELPKHFGKRMKEEILAGSHPALNLRDCSHYFFDVGIRLSQLKRDDDLMSSLRTAFCGDRFKSLMFHCLTNWHEDVAEYSQCLTATELRIFHEGLKTSRDIYRWRDRKASILQKSHILGRRPSTSSSSEQSNKRAKN